MFVNTPDLIGDISRFPRNLGNVEVGTDGNVRLLSGLTRVPEPVLDYYGSNPDNLQNHDALWQILDPSGNVLLRNPKPGTTGNLSTYWLEGPARLGLDAALSKSIQITEGTEFTIRVDAINILNKPQWNNPGGSGVNINSSNFGRITSAGGERTFTMNARIDF